MTNEFKVEVPVKCDRTGKVIRVPMSLEEAKQLQDLIVRKQESADYVETALYALDTETAPDLAVLYKGKVVVLPTIVGGKQEATVLRLLHDLTQRKDLFPIPAKPPSKKSSANTGKSQDAPNLSTNTALSD